MNTEKRLQLIKEVGEEILTEEELKTLLEEKQNPVAYDGFEPSGKIHLPQGILRAININKMTRAGCKFILWEADWHAWINGKLGGDMDKIRTTAKYFEEVWKACEMDMDNVKFVSAQEVINDSEYWRRVVQVAKTTTVQRMQRCSQIMGRKEAEMQYTAQLFYPAMQAADIAHLKIDICQLGIDQRKVNILARETFPKLGWRKPVAVHHRMIAGLQPPPTQTEESIERTIELKMSKSKPENTIFMTDSTEEAEQKIMKAYCPPQEHENPILEYLKYIIFEKIKEITIERPTKYGGDTTFTSYIMLKDAYLTGKIHPLDLKKAVAKEINKLLDPVRKHFSKGKPAELLKQIQGYQITR
ncbi:tyrosine--tRNA ligase [Candidatus Woesearchaeota archaeon]|nr:tyrosine--tRNA ligase [Candidatus Woesearchaeota archaeon]